MTKQHRFAMYQNTIYDDGNIINPFECMKLLNQLNDENKDLKQQNKELRCNIEANSQDDYIEYLKKDNEQLKQDKKRLIGFLHRYKGVDVEDVDEEVLSKEYLDEWGELYHNER